MGELTHWKKLDNPDYLGAYALDKGQDLIVTIKKVQVEEVYNVSNSKKEKCKVIHFEEKNVKPLICNATNSKIIQKLYNTPYVEEWQGKKIQLYTAKIKAFGELLEALRIREYKPKELAKVTYKMICSDCSKKIEDAGTVKAEVVAKHTLEHYKRELCSYCATKIKSGIAEGK